MQRQSLRLLHLIGTLDPAYGGPVSVVLGLLAGCADLGVPPTVATLDSAGDTWLSDVDATVHALGPSYGRYRYCPGLAPWLREHLRPYDALVVHGIWQQQSRTASAVCHGATAAPYFLFVHGALDPWFGRRYPLKHVKKTVYWRLIESRVLRDARAVFYTSEEERRLAKASFRPYRAREAIVPLGIPTPDGSSRDELEAFFAGRESLRDKRLLLFLSRIHPKKGCDLLVEAFAAVSSWDERLHLVVAGPDEIRWKATLVERAHALGVADRITWTGALSGAAKWGAYRAADVLVLPSHSENFGMVVPEALGCGLPVLITNKVNIWRGIVRDGAGLVAEDTVAGTVGLLRCWLALTDEEAASMRVSALACFHGRFGIRGSAQEFLQQVSGALQKESAGVR
jgi:glycosyltransferase involved in cell wall biosynthesis